MPTPIRTSGAIVVWGGPQDLRRGRRRQGDGHLGAGGGAPLGRRAGWRLRSAGGDRHRFDRRRQRLRARRRDGARARLRSPLPGDRREPRTARDQARRDPGRRRHAAAGTGDRAGSHEGARVHGAHADRRGGREPGARRAGPRPRRRPADRGRGRARVSLVDHARRSRRPRPRSRPPPKRPVRAGSRPSGRRSWRCSGRPTSARGWQRSWRSAPHASATERRRSHRRNRTATSVSHPGTTVRYRDAPRPTRPQKFREGSRIGNEPVSGVVRKGY